MIVENLVTIVTPMYNGERFISQTIESVIAQSYRNWEMIIVDDGSNDKGSDIVKKYNLNDSRVKLISQVNAGSAAARNNALRNASGRYICFLDADDILDSVFLENQLSFLHKKRASIVFASYRRINEKGQDVLKPFIVPNKVNYKGLLKTCSISCLTAMFDRKKTGESFFNESLKSMRDDYVFWLNLLKKVEYAYGNPDILASYRFFSASTTGDKKKVMKPQFLIYYKVEKLGMVRSIYYFVHWAVNGFFKYK